MYRCGSEVVECSIGPCCDRIEYLSKWVLAVFPKDIGDIFGGIGALVVR
jgi:hypothetical protein